MAVPSSLMLPANRWQVPSGEKSGLARSSQAGEQVLRGQRVTGPRRHHGIPTAISPPSRNPAVRPRLSPLQKLPGSYHPAGARPAAGPWPGRSRPAPAHSKPSPDRPREPAGGHPASRASRQERRHPSAQPARGELGGGGEGGAVQPRDRAQHGLFHLPGDRRIQLAQPGPLTVPAGPDQNRLPQVMQLDTAMPGPGPHVRQGAAELGVPHQRRQVLDGHRHAHVVDRAVGRHLDRAVCHGMPPEQPDVPGARQVHRLVQGDSPSPRSNLSRCAGRKVLGVAAFAGVAATGAVIIRDQRRRRAYTRIRSGTGCTPGWPSRPRRPEARRRPECARRRANPRNKRYQAPSLPALSQ